MVNGTLHKYHLMTKSMLAISDLEYQGSIPFLLVNKLCSLLEANGN